MKKPKKYIFLLLFVNFVFSQNTTFNISINKPEKLQEELEIALGKDWKIFNYTVGDITNDKNNDIIAIGKSTKNELQNRKIYLFVCIGENLFELKATNENIIECDICGVDGVNDAFEKTQIKNNSFSFEFRYGLGYPLIIEIFFKYDKKKKDWILTKEIEIEYGGGSNQNGNLSADKSEKFKNQYNKITFENFKLK